MKTIDVPISELKPASYNPRKWSDKAIEDLKQSIQEFGLVDPIIVNSAPERKNTVIGGHFRLKVAKELGFTSVPVVYVNVPDLKKEKELNLRLNRNLGEFNYDLLAEFEQDLLKEVGFDSQELDKIFNEEAEEDDFDAQKEYEQIEEPKSKYGEVYQLGRHRLMCGDSTKREDVEKLMNGKKADMLFCDPPYGIDLDTDYTSLQSKSKFVKEKNLKRNTGNRYEKIIGDGIDYDPEHIFRDFGYCKEIFLWGGDYFLKRLPERGSLFVWDKRQTEQFDKMYGSCFELCWSRNRHKREIIRHTWTGIFGTEKEDIRKRIHPTQKPIELCKWFIQKFSKREQNIIDLFGGSGSTLIACEQADRICYMMELDPKYCDIIRKRYEQFVNK